MTNAKYILLIILFAGAGSCGKDFGDINVDPNNPQTVPPEALLSGSEKVLADNVFQYFAVPEMLAQTWTQNNYTTYSQYDIQPVSQNAWFQAHYSGVLKDLEDIQSIVTKKHGLNPAEDSNKFAIAKVLQVYSFQYLTDIFGPVPYSEALQGDKDRTPKYDSQKDIYLGLLEDLHNAMVLMDESAGSFGGADFLYGGDVAKWKKFAHALVLRLAMRMSDAEPDKAKMEVENAWSATFVGNEDNACFQYLSSTPNNNPLYQQRVDRGDADLGLSNILIDKTLKPLDDPRLPVWADEAADGGGYFGRPYGQSSDAAAADPPERYSQPSGAAVVREGRSDFKPYDVLRPEAQACLMGYAEVCFILAEACERGWDVAGTAAEWYAKGISASMQEWGIEDQIVIDAYLAQPLVNYSTAPGDWKQKIGMQKWLALFMQGIQGWSEWRRLDFQKFELPVDGTIGDVGDQVAPVRIVYPSDEQSLNNANYLDALGLLGGPDKLSTRLWWDVQ